MNPIRNYCALLIGLAVVGSTYSLCAGVAAWLFTVTVTYDWSKK